MKKIIITGLFLFGSMAMAERIEGPLPELNASEVESGIASLIKNCSKVDSANEEDEDGDLQETCENFSKLLDEVLKLHRFDMPENDMKKLFQKYPESIRVMVPNFEKLLPEERKFGTQKPDSN